MPLVKCIDCGRMISDRAKNCIFCGCPLEETLKKLSINKETIEKSSSIIEQLLNKLVEGISCADTHKSNYDDNDKGKRYKDTDNDLKEKVKGNCIPLYNTNRYIDFECAPDYEEEKDDWKETFIEGMETLQETGWFYPDETEGEEEDEEWIRLYGSNIRISNYWKK